MAIFLKLKINLIAIVFSFILGITVCYFAVQQMLNALSSDIYRLELKLIEIEHDMDRLESGITIPKKEEKKFKI